VHPGRETSTQYFSYSGGTGTDMAKRAPGNVTPNMFFLHQVGYAGHGVYSSASEA
jgi:hypothetical protein